MDKLQNLLNDFSSKKILLIGDTIIDVYVYGKAIGKSAETPTIVAEKLETKMSLGGAFLVARNILELGATLEFMTLAGEDVEADKIINYKHPNLSLYPLIDSDRPSTVKKRFWVDGYKLLQIDTLSNDYISDTLADQTIDWVKSELLQCDAMIVADNRHGLLSPFLIEQLIAFAKKTSKPVYVDSQLSQLKSNHRLYHGATVICLNKKEALAIDPNYQVNEEKFAFDRLRAALEIENIIVKLGKQGAIAMIHDQVWRADGLDVEAVDTCGAGDAFLSALTLMGLEYPDISLKVANAWAGLSTTIHGTHPPGRSELLAFFGVR